MKRVLLKGIWDQSATCADDPVSGPAALSQLAQTMRRHLDCRAVVIAIADRFVPLLAAGGHAAGGGIYCALAPGRWDRAAGAVITRELAALADPLAARDLGFGFYAGLPLRLASGEHAGMLAAVDLSPRELGGRDLAALKMLAAIIVQIAEFRLATIAPHQPTISGKLKAHPRLKADRGG